MGEEKREVNSNLSVSRRILIENIRSSKQGGALRKQIITERYGRVRRPLMSRFSCSARPNRRTERTDSRLRAYSVDSRALRFSVYLNFGDSLSGIEKKYLVIHGCQRLRVRGKRRQQAPGGDGRRSIGSRRGSGVSPVDKGGGIAADGYRKGLLEGALSCTRSRSCHIGDYRELSIAI